MSVLGHSRTGAAHHRKIVSVPVFRGALGDRVYGHPWAMTNYTRASARMRLTRARTRTRPQPFIGPATASSRAMPRPMPS